MAGGISKPRALDDGAKKIWAQAKVTKSAKVPNNYLGTIGDPVYVQTQVVAGINYAFTFKNGMTVTVNNSPWRHPPITIVEVTHSKNTFTAAPKRVDVAGMHLTQAQRARAFEEFKKQDLNHDGTITNGGAYTGIMHLEGKELQAKHACKGWEEVTQSIVGDKPKKKIRIDDFMSKYTDFEVARRAMKYFSKFAGKDCVLTGKELQTGIQQTFGHGVSKDQVKAIIAKYSKDKDPKVSFQEFFAMYKDYEKSNSEDVNDGKGAADQKGTLTDKESGVAEKGWNALDTSMDGFVQNKEFSAFFQGVVEKMAQGKDKKDIKSQLKAYFKFFAGKDGKLSHVEYLKMMEVMKMKVGTETFDKFLDALTAANCSQLWDCYRCTAANLDCAWVPAFAGGSDDDGQCVEQKAIRFFQAAMLRGKAGLVSGNAFTKQAECGKEYDRPAFSGITTIAVAKGI